MTMAFRDDLLHHIHDAFEGIKETLTELNRHLRESISRARLLQFQAADPGRTPT